ncbi:pentapeptide repeat-containing protein [uncultured Corynebacterium sp.]|uniref:pentapeptide repeat-containing protein n=1 Tax=uncultured Corynebacterium sp. TaxID=159447 RepID=UPI0025CFF040|nr:pentapeptide repeat-containing protein [uncultured Corynebacterium sp.]
MRSTPTVAPDVGRLAASATDFPGRLDEVDPSLLGPRQDHELAMIADGDMSRDLSGLGLIDCRLERLTAHGAVLTGARITDTILTTVNATSLTASRASLQDVILRDSRLGAVDLVDAGVHGLIVERCSIDFLNVRGTDLTDVLFHDCRIGDLDLGGVRADRVSFVDCQVDAFDAVDARARNVDLRGLEIHGIRNPDGLRGMTLSPVQVALLSTAFARHLGIRVEE